MRFRRQVRRLESLIEIKLFNRRTELHRKWKTINSVDCNEFNEIWNHQRVKFWLR
ncbi:MAG: hypothetical protein ACTS6H_01665 [Candidatus Hodgkinia cicadicola]